MDEDSLYSIFPLVIRCQMMIVTIESMENPVQREHLETCGLPAIQTSGGIPVIAGPVYRALRRPEPAGQSHQWFP